MKLMLCLELMFFVGSLAVKEQVDDTDLMTQSLWKIVRKRLKDYDYDPSEIEDLDRAFGTTPCGSPEIRNSTIIRTHDSQNAGAKFLNTPDAETRALCLEECCATEGCNVAVFKEKDGDHACYLFDCGTPNVCKFTSHPGYSVVTLPTRKTTNRIQEKHENDLENLAQDSTTTTTTTTTTTITTPAPTDPPQPAEPVPLFGNCQSHKDCAGSYTKCSGGHCMCQGGYHPQEGTCRKDCSKFEFQCRNSGQPLVYPQCIAIYNKCDGIALCQDGSDEENCDRGNGKELGRHQESTEVEGGESQKDTVAAEPAGKKAESVPVVPEEVKDSTDDSKSAAEKSDVEVSQEEQTEEEQTKEQEAEQQHEIHEGEVVQEEPAHTDNQEQASTDNKVKVSTGGDKVITGGDKVVTGGDKESQEEEAEHEQEAESDKSEVLDIVESSVIQAVNKSPQTDNSEIQDLESGMTLIQMSEEEEAEARSQLSRFYQSNRGAVVALSLGLVVTALLLIFVGCRLRNVKKRLRKGRPLNSNEADYLINGMYL